MIFALVFVVLLMLYTCHCVPLSWQEEHTDFLHIWAAWVVITKVLDPWMGPGAITTMKLKKGEKLEDLGDPELLPTHKNIVMFTVHSLAFLTLAGLALAGHGKAMTTNNPIQFIISSSKQHTLSESTSSSIQ